MSRAKVAVPECPRDLYETLWSEARLYEPFIAVPCAV